MKILFDLSKYCREGYGIIDKVRLAIWLPFSVVFTSWLPGSFWRIYLLKAFGAIVGSGVIIKPGVKIKQPWLLQLGNYVWIGEGVWIDNIAEVKIGSNVCVSQMVYFCTGNHDYKSIDFALSAQPIIIKDSVWIGARSTILPGCFIASNQVFSACSKISVSSLVKK